MSVFTKWFVPVTALVAGYKAIVGERESGTIKLLLALPHTRGDVVLGKVTGRALAVLVPVLAGFAIAAGVSAVLYTTFAPDLYLAFVGLNLLLALAFVSLAVALSAAFRSTVRAVTAAVGAFVLFTFMWDLVPAGVYLLVNGQVPGSSQLPAWYFLVGHLNPSNAYTALITASFPNLVSPMPDARPVYLADGVTFGLLLAWVVVPLTLGYYRFLTTELS
jgi:ABC-2 type transport system permease protein